MSKYNPNFPDYDKREPVYMRKVICVDPVVFEAFERLLEIAKKCPGDTAKGTAYIQYKPELSIIAVGEVEKVRAK